ncbi:MAG: outer membrane protein transport protein [Desulfuromonas sp.]|nr:outer membrane protein transport protein [Desulfuromonas sp.]
MKRIFATLCVLCCALILPQTVFATNGDNLIGVGPVSRAMGGVGIAAPQDAISATFSNPAAMNFGPFCPQSHFDFAATLYSPSVDAKVTMGNNAPLKADSDTKVYMVPAFGISTPINDKARIGLSAYGITGLGVDYRDTDIAGTGAVDSTQLMILKFAPTFAYQITDKLSIGLAIHAVNSSLDLDNGTSSNYGFGGQLGAIYRLSNTVSLGATYQSPVNADHENVFDMDSDGSMDDFAFEAPQSFGIGVAWKIAPELLVEVNGQWLNWSEANGYDDLDWEDQYVVSLGVQYQVQSWLTLRCGYNYGKNQVNEHNNFDGSSTISIQGKDVNRYGYETLRIIGFPAVCEHHMTLGLGFNLSQNLLLNIAYQHAFKTTVKSSGTLPDGITPVDLESNLSENGIDFSLSWRF